MIFLKRWIAYNKTKHYEKSLDLWKDADPGIVEVEDARKKMALRWNIASSSLIDKIKFSTVEKAAWTNS